MHLCMQEHVHFILIKSGYSEVAGQDSSVNAGSRAKRKQKTWAGHANEDLQARNLLRAAPWRKVLGLFSPLVSSLAPILHPHSLSLGVKKYLCH